MEEKKKELEELYDELQEEEENCFPCERYTQYGNAACEECGTHGNIQELKAQIAALEGLENDNAERTDH